MNDNLFLKAPGVYKLSYIRTAEMRTVLFKRHILRIGFCDGDKNGDGMGRRTRTEQEYGD